MRKLLSVLVSLIVVMALVSCTNDAEVSIANSFGYDEVARVIESAEDFVAFANEVVAGNSFAGEVVVLNRDITLSAEEFVPAGNSENPFEGIFDGGNNTITYSCSNDVVSTPSYVGLFASTCNAEIKNINITVKAELTTSNDDFKGFGGVIGLSKGSLLLSEIRIAGDIASYDNIGSLVGVIDEGEVVIENCVSFVNLRSYEGEGIKVGGLVGSVLDGVEIKVNDCGYYGEATSGEWLGACFGGIGVSRAEVLNINAEGYWGKLNGNSLLGYNLAYYGYADEEAEVMYKDEPEMTEWAPVTSIEEN